jgi:hypothetical protein
MLTSPTTSVEDAGWTVRTSPPRPPVSGRPHDASGNPRVAIAAADSPEPFCEAPARPLARLTVVEASACHFCDDANAALDELAGRYPISVATIAAESDVGRELIARHGAPMVPLVLVDGSLFSCGRLPRRKLERLLAARSAAAGSVGA